MATQDDTEPVPSNDIDFISEDGSAMPGPEPLTPYSSGLMGRPNPVFVPSQSTPLEGGEEGQSLPRFAAWSMKYLQRSHLFSRSEIEVQEHFGHGSSEIYVMDDGRKHCLICRQVGVGSDGCIYCLVGHISVADYEQLVDGGSTEVAFSMARGISLCAVFEAVDAVSNVSVVDSYDTADQVPADYLPPHPPIDFE